MRATVEFTVQGQNLTLPQLKTMAEEKYKKITGEDEFELPSTAEMHVTADGSLITAKITANTRIG